MHSHLRLGAPLCVTVALFGLAACGSTVSTSNYKGEPHAVAQTLANLQSDMTAGEQKKVCANDLAAAVVARLGGANGCEKAIKEQLAQVDNLELSAETIKLDAAGTTATATVKTTYAGKKRLSTVTLVKEGGSWKLAKLG
jgi:hypothetical protein